MTSTDFRVETQLTADVNAGDSSLPVQSTAGFSAADGIWIERTGTNEEQTTVGGAEKADNGYVWQQRFDSRSTDTFNLPLESYGTPRFDVMAYMGCSGASQATPQVAGLAAMLLQQGINDPAVIEAALGKFATPCSESLNRGDADVAANRNNTFGLIEARNTFARTRAGEVKTKLVRLAVLGILACADSMPVARPNTA